MITNYFLTASLTAIWQGLCLLLLSELRLNKVQKNKYDYGDN